MLFTAVSYYVVKFRPAQVTFNVTWDAGERQAVGRLPQSSRRKLMKASVRIVTAGVERWDQALEVSPGIC